MINDTDYDGVAAAVEAAAVQQRHLCYHGKGSSDAGLVLAMAVVAAVR